MHQVQSPHCCWCSTGWPSRLRRCLASWQSRPCFKNKAFNSEVSSGLASYVPWNSSSSLGGTDLQLHQLLNALGWTIQLLWALICSGLSGHALLSDALGISPIGWVPQSGNLRHAYAIHAHLATTCIRNLRWHLVQRSS